MKTFAISLISSVCVIAALAWSPTSRAQTVPLVFQTTFNCPEWNETMGLLDAIVCSIGDGIAGYGAWTAPNHPAGDQITTAANNPSGGGGKGFRHWAGNGMNQAGGGLLVIFPPTTEMWFRYSIRFQPGFRWSASGPCYMKTIYVNSGIPGTFYFGVHDCQVGGHVEAMSTVNHYTSASWTAIGDGNWHSVELHTKMNLPGGSSNGVMEVWVDGTKVYTNTAMQFSTTTGATWAKVNISSNENSPDSGSASLDQYIDYDDIAISTTGYIGPVGVVAPRNLSVQ